MIIFLRLSRSEERLVNVPQAKKLTTEALDSINLSRKNESSIFPTPFNSILNESDFKTSG